MRAVPMSLREGAYAMGSTRFQTAVRVVLRAAISGACFRLFLGISRAVGETMIVAVAAGMQPTLPWHRCGQTIGLHRGQVAMGDLPAWLIGYQSRFSRRLQPTSLTLSSDHGTPFAVVIAKPTDTGFLKMKIKTSLRSAAIIRGNRRGQTHLRKVAGSGVDGRGAGLRDLVRPDGDQRMERLNPGLLHQLSVASAGECGNRRRGSARGRSCRDRLVGRSPRRGGRRLISGDAPRIWSPHHRDQRDQPRRAPSIVMACSPWACSFTRSALARAR